MEFVESKDSLIIKEFRKPRGSLSRLIRYYKCKCSTKECNVISDIDIYVFKKWSGYCKKCSNLKKLTAIDRKLHTTAKRPYEALYNNLIKQAKRRKKQFSLTLNDFVEFTKQSRCHYCYSNITWTKVNLSTNGFRTNLDRKDNSKGYEVENLVVCCWRCNNGRRNLFTYEEWFRMTKFFRDNTDQKGEIACSGPEGCEVK